MAWVAVMGLVGCAASDDEAPVDSDSDVEALCADPGGSTAIVTGIGHTEGATIAPDGTAYVVHRDLGLLRVAHDGTTTTIASFEDGIGATWWKGAVWVAQPSSELHLPALIEVAPDGTVTRHDIDEPAAPNFLTPTPWGTLLVADDTIDVVREWTPGATTTTAWADVPSPNGIAFSPDAGTVWVASTFRQPGLWSIAVTDGVAGTPEQVATLDGAPDGVAVAVDGSVLVALNVGGRIAVVKEGVVDEIVPDPATLTPASLAFGRGDWNACAVLTTELFGEDVVAIEVGTTGFFPSWEEGP